MCCWFYIAVILWSIPTSIFIRDVGLVFCSLLFLCHLMGKGLFLAAIRARTRVGAAEQGPEWDKGSSYGYGYGYGL